MRTMYPSEEYPTFEQGLSAAAAEFLGRMQPHAQRALLETTARWPLYPFLCLRRVTEGQGGSTQLGLLIAAIALNVPEYRYTVFRLNYYEIGTSVRSLGALLSAPQITYPSFDAMMADGWVVD